MKPKHDAINPRMPFQHEAIMVPSEFQQPAIAEPPAAAPARERKGMPRSLLWNSADAGSWTADMLQAFWDCCHAAVSGCLGAAMPCDSRSVATTTAASVHRDMRA